MCLFLITNFVETLVFKCCFVKIWIFLAALNLPAFTHWIYNTVNLSNNQSVNYMFKNMSETLNWSLHTKHYLQCTTHYKINTAHYLQCTLHTICYTTLHYTIFTVHYTLHNKQCTLYTYTVSYTLSMHCPESHNWPEALSSLVSARHKTLQFLGTTLPRKLHPWDCHPVEHGLF